MKERHKKENPKENKGVKEKGGGKKGKKKAMSLAKEEREEQRGTHHYFGTPLGLHHACETAAEREREH